MLVSFFCRISCLAALCAFALAGCGYDPCNESSSCGNGAPPRPPQLTATFLNGTGTTSLSWTFTAQTKLIIIERQVDAQEFAIVKIINDPYITQWFDGTKANDRIRPNTYYAYRIHALNEWGDSGFLETVEVYTPSIGELGGDIIPTGSDTHVRVRVVQGTTYACLFRANNEAGSTAMVNGDTVEFDSLDPAKKITDIIIPCTWGVAPSSRQIYVVSNLSNVSSADLTGSTKIDGTGATTTLVGNALGNRPYQIFDPTIKMVVTQTGALFAQFIYDNGAFGVVRPLRKGQSGVTLIDGSGVLE